MQSNLGDSVTLYDILSRNQKKQSWDPWLPNSYICQDEQPVQPLAHDPNAQGSMYSSMAVQALRNHGQSPEDMFIATMNSAKANGDTNRYTSMLSQWQTNYGIPTTSKIWYDASNPNNYQYEKLIHTVRNPNEDYTVKPQPESMNSNFTEEQPKPEPEKKPEHEKKPAKEPETKPETEKKPDKEDDNTPKKFEFDMNLQQDTDEKTYYNATYGKYKFKWYTDGSIECTNSEDFGNNNIFYKNKTLFVETDDKSMDIDDYLKNTHNN
ncbi:hypothetical protein WA158_006990 [Blastocystis sp. Blastoise]